MIDTPKSIYFTHNFFSFINTWEQRKFLDLLDAQYGIRRGPFGSSLKKDSFVKKSDYVVYEQQNAIYDNYETRYFISKEKYNELIRFNIQPGDFIMSGAGTIGRISMVPDGIKKGVFNQALIRFKVNKDSINPLYFLKFMQSDMMQKQLTQANPGSAMTNLVPMDELKKWDVTIPSLEEQNKISTFINQIDEFITLHQRKLDNLKLKKKALLQKLFPKNGERYPELRFPGFTDAWEQRKANYIFNSVTDKGYPELPVLSASQELGMVYRDQNGIDIQHDKKNETSYKRVLPGQFVIHLRSFQGGFAYSEVEGITSPAYTVMSFKNSSEQYGLFWKHVFKSETFIKRLETITYGIRDGRSISFSDFKSLILQYPSFSEQKLIGGSIEIIESGITLHQ